ncbi:phage integrase [Leptolyngbya boryana NIES-2135]|jgi:integrase|uniref:Phage integrase n=1 Tax=Leptolyngbya boryana NIES-2135 TaxID=1973484 RepID=A0A1Z4JPC9_LEPBY|nr:MULTISPECIES: hypothetical protein [Leptolyngbya]BAY58574.1 phage integrase [Leptolyngbya boryana NIES-2135]MBD2370750.1 integrase [Leptolyngbya sp. FACHB-161]MBD2377097.1 integrase [Leptolyngbya sp. FACHB-238]MBD2401540.1 integrase [Leptolyngbya sp. FACHB-239]MBD2408092.1 integrase [Leptolyngbya sp. FACHB-402]
MINLAEYLQKANDRLKAFGVKLVLQGKGDWLYLRGTFPPKPGENRKPYSTKIALKMRAIDKAAIDAAEKVALQVGLDLNLGQFDWRKFSDFDDPDSPATKKIGDWVEAFEKEWWLTRDRKNQSNQSTWLSGYQRVLKGLPKDVELTEDLLVQYIAANSSPHTVNRRHYVTCCKLLAETAGISSARIKALTPKIGIKPVNPRDIPDDKTISQVRESIKDPGWQYLYGLIAVYGLRNHEVFYPDLREFPILRTRKTSKTGERPVKPLYPEWAEAWKLGEVIYPKQVRITAESSNRQMGVCVTAWFQNNMPFNAYNLRHAYAGRCDRCGVPPKTAAKMMGHTLQVHELVYGAWLDEAIYLDVFDRAVNHPDRPLPPETTQS